MATIKDTSGNSWLKDQPWRKKIVTAQSKATDPGSELNPELQPLRHQVVSKQSAAASFKDANQGKHKGINGWLKKSGKHWTELKGKNVGQWLSNPVGIVGGRVAEDVRALTDVNTYTEGTNMEGFSLMPLNKLWRTKLFINRAKSLKDKAGSPLAEGGWVPSLFSLKASAKGDPAQGVTTKTNPIGEVSGNTQKRRDIGRKALGLTVINPSNVIETEPEFPTYKDSKLRSNELTLQERRQQLGQHSNHIIIVSPFTSPYKAIQLQCRPNEIQVTPQSTWAAVSSMGRNNPFRMYTGGEDTIQFDICWYCNDPNNRGEVVTKCRLLESWSKANGYVSAPPVLQLLWGASNIYKDDFFILESASYKLTHFQDLALKIGNPELNEVGSSYLNLGLYPNYATQTLVFKRVSSVNRTWDQIVSLDDLKKTQGITLIDS